VRGLSLPSLPTSREKLERYLKANYVTEERNGILYVWPEKTYVMPEVLEYKIRDTTPILRHVRQKYLRNIIHRNLETMRYFYGIEGLLRKVCVMYKDPVIDFDIVPLKTKNVVFHMLSWRITGDIVNQLTNKSKEGEQGTYKTRRWKSCPTDPSVYQWETVKGSADILPDWLHSFAEDQTGTFLARVKQAASRVAPGMKTPEVSASWQKSGVGSGAFMTLLGIFLTGKVTLRNGYDVTIKYYWKGQEQTVNRHVDSVVVLPVEGSVGIAWD
jgi:hypothetical protein